MLPAAAATAIVAGLLGYLFAGSGRFHPSACRNVEAALGQELVGQRLAVEQLTEAVCHHLAQARPANKPLVISSHGPPGVGKTFTHLLLARALYGASTDSSHTAAAPAPQCPGPHCVGYKVYYGMDYLEQDRAVRLRQLADSLRRHLARSRDVLVVVEEYDKLDCAARGLWRQLLQHPEVHGVHWDRAIVLLESNLGMAEVAKAAMAAAAGDGQQLSPEAWGALLRDLVFSRWRDQDCESVADTLALTGLVDFWLPYMPLGAPEVAQLVARGLSARGAALQADKGLRLEWDEDVVALLLGKVEMDAGAALDGAKSVESVLTRHVGRLLRTAPPATGAAPRRVLRLHVDGPGRQGVAASLQPA